MTHDEARLSDRDKAANKVAERVGLYLQAIEDKEGNNRGTDDWWKYAGEEKHHLQVLNHLYGKYTQTQKRAQLEATA